MNIIARAALYIYDGSSMAPIFPEKVSKPCDEAAAYLSAVADKIMASDGSRTTCVEPNSAPPVRCSDRRRCSDVLPLRRFRKPPTR